MSSRTIKTIITATWHFALLGLLRQVYFTKSSFFYFKVQLNRAYYDRHGIYFDFSRFYIFYLAPVSWLASKIRFS